MNHLSPSAPIWGQAFRPLFLFAAAFSALALAIWGAGFVAMLYGAAVAGIPHFGPVSGTFWHSHEMLFGFAAAVVAGFLLTAVQNWTGRRATNGKPLLILAMVWLAARVLMLLGDLVPWWLTAAVDMTFMPMVAWFFFSLLFQVRQTHNYFFAVVMLIMTAMNGVMHYGNHINDLSLVWWGGHAVSLMIVLFISVVAGRVLPMFTANGTGAPRVPNLEWLDKAVLGSTWLFVMLFILRLDSLLPGWAMALLCVLAAFFQGFRIFRLRLRTTLKTPLVWSLHLAYWFIPLGFVLMALHYLNLGVAFSTALHALTAGAIGGMIIAMIARVALGHSGRPLIPHPLMSWAFASVLLAALLRSVVLAIVPQWALPLYVLSALLWVAGFAIYVALYTQIVTTPRPDGRIG